MKKIYVLIYSLSTAYIFSQENYLVENFDYTASNLLSDNGWNVHGGGSTNPIAVTNGGLTWSGFIGSGIGKAAAVTASGIDVNRRLAKDISDGSVYASFLLKPSAALTSLSTENFFFHFLRYSNTANPDYTSINSNHRARTFILQGSNPATQFKLGINFNAADYISPTNVTTDLDISKTYLIVVKYTFVPGDTTNDTVSLYVFSEGDNINIEPSLPTLGPFSATLTGTAPNQVLAADATLIQGIALRQNSNGQNVIVDGIYVRKVWDLTSPGTSLNIKKFDKNREIRIYPNPVTNKNITISSESSGVKEIALFDANGKEVLKKNISTEELDLNLVKSGVYFIQIKIGTKIEITKLIVK